MIVCIADYDIWMYLHVSKHTTMQQNKRLTVDATRLEESLFFNDLFILQ